MADKPISGLPAITNLDPTDLIAAVHQGMTGHAQLSTLLAFITSNLSAAQLNQLLQAEVRIRVSAPGDVSNAPGRLPITATRPTQGKYVLTCPSGWVWHSAVGSGQSQDEVRIVNPGNFGNQTLDVTTFDANNAPFWVGFSLVGLLVPA